MRLAMLLIVLAIVVLGVSMNMPILAAIPTGLHTSIPEPSLTKCEKYIATHAMERMDDWIYTLEQGLLSNMQLGQDVWECVMDTYKVAETDQFMLRSCRANPNATFKDLALDALAEHLDQCGLGFER